MRILVTGGTGFIGSHLVDRLVKEHQVVVVDDASGSVHINKKAYSIKTDCRDTKKMDTIMRVHKPEIVYHLAANAAENKSVFSPIDITSRNYDAFIKTITPAIKYGIKRFVFTSSIAVYGALQTPFKEEDKPEPEDLYGITKLAIEQSIKVLANVHDFEYVITRPHNVYGPRQNMADPYRNVVTIWMNAKLNGKPCYIYGDGEQRRCFSYIDDVVEAIYKCGFDNVSGRTFNIGADTHHSLNELARAIDVIPEHLPERPQEVKEAIADHTQSQVYLNYQDKTSLSQGIEKTWRWVESVGPVELKYDTLEIPNSKVPKNWL